MSYDTKCSRTPQKSQLIERSNPSKLLLQDRSFPARRGGSTSAATSEMELFVIIVNGFQPSN